ncbi:MAG: hypothetical protein J6Z36_03520, partial [Clostridia bacterium]|nr:hypothetical protein [Clostridia bacterium]
MRREKKVNKNHRAFAYAAGAFFFVIWGFFPVTQKISAAAETGVPPMEERLLQEKQNLCLSR